MCKADQIKLEMDRILEHIVIHEPGTVGEMVYPLGMSDPILRDRIGRMNDTKHLPDVGRVPCENGHWRWHSSLTDPRVLDRNHRHVYTINEGMGHKMDRQVAVAAVSQPEVVPVMLNRMDATTPNELRPGVSDAVRELRATPSGCAALSKWKSGDDPMTPKQSVYITSLARERGVPVPAVRTKWEAHLVIDELREAT